MGFCSSCGSEVNERDAFCSKCGAKITEAGQQGIQGMPNTVSNTVSNTMPNTVPNTLPNTAPNVVPNTYDGYSQENRKPNNNKLIGMIAVGVVALVGFLLLFKVVGLFTTPGYEKPVKYLVDGLQDGDYKKMIKAFPDFIAKELKDQVKDYGEKDYMDMMTDSLKSEYGKRFKVSFKITDKDKLDKDELDSLEENIKWMYDKKVKIKEGYLLELEMKIKGSKGSDEDDTRMTVYKIGSNWYLTEDSFGF